MKNTKNFAKRSLAILLVLVLCLGLSPLTVLADDEVSAETPTESTQTSATGNKSAEDAGTYIPDDATTSTDTTTDGNTTTDTETKTWGPNEEGKWEQDVEDNHDYDFTFTPKGEDDKEDDDVDLEGSEGEELDSEDADGDDVDTEDADGEDEVLTEEDVDGILDDLTSGDLDRVGQYEDGTYTKTETDTTTTTTTEKSGSQTKNDNVTSNQDGSTTFTGDVEGHEDTTITEETTGTETTTEVTKETEDQDVVTDNKGEAEDESITDKADGKFADVELADDIDVKLGNDVFEDTHNSVSVTVSKSSQKSTNSTPSTQVNTGKATEYILDALTSYDWTIVNGDDKYTLEKTDDGIVIYNADGEDVTESVWNNIVTWTENEDGTYTYAIDVKKVKVYDVKAKGYVGGDFEWLTDEDYKIEGSKLNADGSVTQTYVKETTEETDEGTVTIRTYYIVTTRTDGKMEVTETATVTGTLKNAYLNVEAEWKGATVDGKDFVGGAFGPSSTVLGDWQSGHFNTWQTGTNFEEDSLGNSIWNLADGYVQSHLKVVTAGGVGGTEILPQLIKVAGEDGTLMWTYCVERDRPTNGSYEYTDFVNANDHPVFGEFGAQIQYIVANGWWGTESGAGSLNALKAFLGENQYAKDLTHGAALAATQAALWHFTSNEDSAPTGEFVSSNNNVTDRELEAAKALYNALINGASAAADEEAPSVEAPTEMVDVDSISTSVNVKEKANVGSVEELNQLIAGAKDSAIGGENKEGATALNTTDDLYLTNVSVDVAVIPSSLANDLIVYVYCDNVAVASKRVSKADFDGKVTIEDVVLKNKGTIEFELSGAQTLDAGAYVFSTGLNAEGNTTSQTLVGFVSGANSKHTFTATANMTFTVEESDTAIEKSGTVNGSHRDFDESHTGSVKVTEKVTKKDIYEKNVTENTVEWADSYEYTVPGTTTRTGDDDDADDDDADIPDDDVPLAPGDDDVDIDDEDTPLAGAPEEEEFEIFEEEVPLAPAAPEEFVILDEDVPLAAVPTTGDASAVWFYITILSAAGLLCLLALENKKSKEN